MPGLGLFGPCEIFFLYKKSLTSFDRAGMV